MPDATPSSVPPTSPPVASAVFSVRNWWNQGVACKVLVICAGVVLLMLFQPWDFSVAGHYTTEPTIGSRTSIVYGVQSSGSSNAFAQHEGWIPLVGLLTIFYFCGQSRSGLGSRIWIPFLATIILLACSIDAIRSQRKQVDAWLSGFDRSNRPRAQIAAAIYWTNIFGFVMAVAAYRHAKQASDKRAATV